jgi:hypothetical protein
MWAAVVESVKPAFIVAQGDIYVVEGNGRDRTGGTLLYGCYLDQFFLHGKYLLV